MRISHNDLHTFLRDRLYLDAEGNEDKIFTLDDPEPYLIISVASDSENPLGYLVIDTLAPGICSGGIRMAPDVTVEELIHLARAMTLKFAFKNSFIGGAKGGIIFSGDASPHKKSEVLETYGQKLGPIMKTIYSPGGDIGVGPDEVVLMKKGAGLDFKKTHGSEKAGLCTAYGVFASARTLAKTREKDLSRCTIALEGYGNVGRPLARLLDRIGCRIVALSTICGGLYNSKGLDIGRLERLAEKWEDHAVEKYENAEKIDKADLFTADVDVLIPGARPWSIHEHNAARIKAGAVVPAANIPVTRKAAQILQEKGIIFIPDFVTTSGGILGGYLLNRGFKQEDVFAIMDKTYGLKITRLLEVALAQNKSVEDVAVQIAKSNFKRLRTFQAMRRNKIRYYIFLLKNEKSLEPMIHRVAAYLYLNLNKKYMRLKNLFKRPAIADALRYAADDTKYYPPASLGKKKDENIAKKFHF
jgi:glutamate dehydrogenase/leucine dehydrogenase